MQKFGDGKIFVVKHSAIEPNGTIIIPAEVNQIINMGYHYCGNNIIWQTKDAWHEEDVDTGKFLVGMRLETVARDLVDIEIWENITYISVQEKNTDKIGKVIGMNPKYVFPERKKEV